MEASEFFSRLSSLTVDDIRTLADGVRRTIDTADGELAWWKATVVVSSELRRAHRTREAGLAAHRAVAAVQTVATQAGIVASDRDAVTVVARAAADAARAFVAERFAADERSAAMAHAVLAGWLESPVLAA